MASCSLTTARTSVSRSAGSLRSTPGSYMSKSAFESEVMKPDTAESMKPDSDGLITSKREALS